VLQIAIALKLLLLQLSGSPAVEWRDGHGCQYGKYACLGVTFGDPRSPGGSAIVA